MSKMEKLLREVIARAVRTNFAGNTAKAYESLYLDSLRDSGLLRLLQAGQAMRDFYEYRCSIHKENIVEWDAALAAIEEQSKAWREAG